MLIESFIFHDQMLVEFITNWKTLINRHLKRDAQICYSVDYDFSI